jgi:hypothetical protein
LIGVEPEVIQCAPANRIRVLVLCKGLRRPANGIGRLGNRPWHTAVALVVKRAVVRKSRFLRGRVKVDVTYVYSNAQRHAERLNRAIQVLVINGVLIVPNSVLRSHLETDEEGPVISEIRLVTGHVRACACPSSDRRLLLHGRARR